jgi:TonB family protein
MRVFPALLALSISAVLLCACQSAPEVSKCAAAPSAEMKAAQAERIKGLPDAFVKRYAAGDQQRDMQAIARMIELQGTTLKPYFNALALRHPFVGQFTVVFALTPAGDVAAAQLIGDDTADPSIDSQILPVLKKMNFGAACGSGYFDFQVPFSYEAPIDAASGLEGLRQELRGILHQYLTYPLAAVEDAVTGVAIVRLHVSRDGTVAEANLVRTSGSLVLDNEAIEVWKRLPKHSLEIPAEVEPDAREVVLELPITFQLAGPRMPNGSAGGR